MDLALEMGRTVAELSATMTEVELARWDRYRREQRFPTRRIEWHLAQVARMLAASDKPLRDFLIEFDYTPAPKVDPNESGKQQAAGFAAVAGRGVYVLGKGRKRA